MVLLARPDRPDQASRELTERLASRPEVAKVRECLQCGTCSASCPVGDLMDYTPRQVIALYRAGRLEEALRSRTVWLCASCYSCVARCPSKIPLTDVMYEMKRLGLRMGLTSGRDAGPRLAREFARIIGRNGRNAEFRLIMRVLLRTHPLTLLRQAPMGVRFWRRGRVALGAPKIRGTEELHRILAKVREKETA